MYDEFNEQNSSKVSVEPVSEGDFPAIGEIHAQSFLGLYENHMPANALRKIKPEKMSRDWQDSFENDCDLIDFIVIKEDEHVVGFGVSLLDTTQGDAVAKISECHVAEDKRGLGYGSRLLNTLISNLGNKGYDSATIFVSTDNDAAQTLYEHLGAYVECEKDNNIMGFRIAHYCMRFSNLAKPNEPIMTMSKS